VIHIVTLHASRYQGGIMRLYRRLDGGMIVTTKDLDEVTQLRNLGFAPTPGCPFSMEPFSKPQNKLWYDFGIHPERAHEIGHLVGQ
jgi:hypothetical protein